MLDSNIQNSVFFETSATYVCVDRRPRPISEGGYPIQIDFMSVDILVWEVLMCHMFLKDTLTYFHSVDPPLAPLFKYV